MGFSTGAYHFYGVNIPKNQWMCEWPGDEGERIDAAIDALKDRAPQVRHLLAGGYDRDMLFLCIYRPGHSTEIPVGEFRVVSYMNAVDLGWDAQLLSVTHAMGYENLDGPGWITVPDIS